MARLTKANQTFLNRHGISLDQVFDATGLSRRDYGPLMKEADCVAAIGVTRCSKGNHSLRNARGTCIQCFPATIEFAARARSSGYVYILESVSLGLVKLGLSKDVADRVKQANTHGLGGVFDWKARATLKSKAAGRIEIDAHESLKEFREFTEWARTGRVITSKEIYRCSYVIAKSRLEAVLTARDRSRIKEL